MNIDFPSGSFSEPPLSRFVYKYLGLLLFGIALIVGVLTYDNYGMAWDDPIQRETGILNFDYIFHDDKSLLSWKDRDYGPVFEVLLIAGERTLDLKDLRDIYLFRHLATHTFFLIGGLFCFFLVDLLYKNKKLAALAFSLIVLHPRLYAHSFINTKDIPFLAMFFMSFYLLALAFQRKRVLHFLLLGIAVGITINLRIMGVMLLFIVPVFLILDIIFERRWRRYILHLITFISASLLTLYVTWPILWRAPVDNFIWAFNNMRNFRWTNYVLFNGEMIRATELPWYYLPEWFIITTPILFLVFGILGGGLLLLQMAKHPLKFIRTTSIRNNIVYVSCFIAPFLAVIYFQSTVYDGWRQVFFVYAGFVMLIIYAVHKLAARKFVKMGFAFSIVYLIGASAYYFPYQNVYFNSFLEFKESQYIRRHFEMDYWGTANREALRYILENDTSSIIKVGAATPTPLINRALLKPGERARLDMDQNITYDYYITNYRWEPEDPMEYWGLDIYSIRRGRNTICTVYKTNK